MVDRALRTTPGLTVPDHRPRTSPTLSTAQDPNSAPSSLPTAISPCLRDITAGLVSSSPQPCQGWPWALPSQASSVGLVLAQPQPIPMALPSHLRNVSEPDYPHRGWSWGCLQLPLSMPEINTKVWKQCGVCPEHLALCSESNHYKKWKCNKWMENLFKVSKLASFTFHGGKHGISLKGKYYHSVPTTAIVQFQL